MFTLEITQSAETDLDKITDYLGFSLSNPQAALALLDGKIWGETPRRVIISFVNLGIL